MTFVTAQLSNPGGRGVNQDACGSRSLGSGVHGWVLADGLGGHDGGEVAAQSAVRAVLAALDHEVTVSARTLQRCIEAAQSEILSRQRASEAAAALRSTVVLLLADDKEALWAHVGDSRLYHLHEGRIVHQTADHSLPQALVAAGDLGFREIRHHDDRSRLTRSLGGSGHARPTIQERPCPSLPGDAFLLCSDGFWEYVYETEIEADFAKADRPDAWLAAMHERLYRRGGAAGDNYSAVAIFRVRG